VVRSYQRDSSASGHGRSVDTEVAMRVLLSLACAATTVALSACHPAAAPGSAAAPLPTYAAASASRYELDNQILNWCTARKGLPGTQSECTCLADQLHVQRLSDDGARDFVQVLYSVGPGSDPPLERLPSDHRSRLSRAAELCGTTLP
jgi:hypothetical protein